MQRAQAAGIKMSVMALLGVAGRERSREHAIATGKVFSEMDPRFASCLTVTLVPGTPLHASWEAGAFELLDPDETLEELRLIVENTHVTGTIFRANHASNYLPIGGRLPADREKLLETIGSAQRGEINLKPEFLRGL